MCYRLFVYALQSLPFAVGNVLIFSRQQGGYLRGRFGCVHDPADVGQASAALRVIDAAVAAAETLGGLNLFHDQRAAVSKKILPDIFGRILKTMADRFLHENSSPKWRPQSKRRLFRKAGLFRMVFRSTPGTACRVDFIRIAYIFC